MCVVYQDHELKSQYKVENPRIGNTTVEGQRAGFPRLSHVSFIAQSGFARVQPRFTETRV